jgi:hypothetical protein
MNKTNIVSEWGNNRIIQSTNGKEYILQKNVKSTWLSLEQSSDIEQLKQSADEYQVSEETEYNPNKEDEMDVESVVPTYPLHQHSFNNMGGFNIKMKR